MTLFLKKYFMHVFLRIMLVQIFYLILSKYYDKNILNRIKSMIVDRSFFGIPFFIVTHSIIKFYRYVIDVCTPSLLSVDACIWSWLIKPRFKVPI